MPPAEVTVKTAPRVLKFSVALPPAAMAASVSVCVAPSLARVSVTVPGDELVNV